MTGGRSGQTARPQAFVQKAEKAAVFSFLSFREYRGRRVNPVCIVSCVFFEKREETSGVCSRDE